MKVIANFEGDNRFLSNFYVCSIERDGIWYTSTEAAFQAEKTLDFNKRKEIAKMNPAQSKRAGKKLVLRSDWEQIKIQVMYELVFQKFSCHFDLREKLLATGEAKLIEGNWWNDTFWGVCKGVGENKLGEILMHVRQELKELIK